MAYIIMAYIVMAYICARACVCVRVRVRMCMRVRMRMCVPCGWRPGWLCRRQEGQHGLATGLDSLVPAPKQTQRGTQGAGRNPTKDCNSDVASFTEDQAITASPFCFEAWAMLMSYGLPMFNLQMLEARNPGADRGVK